MPYLVGFHLIHFCNSWSMIIHPVKVLLLIPEFFKKLPQPTTLFTFSILPPLKFEEALFFLQTSFNTLSPSSTMIKDTKIISIFGISWKIKQKSKICKESGIYKSFIAGLKNELLFHTRIAICLAWKGWPNGLGHHVIHPESALLAVRIFPTAFDFWILC